jgi:eukaryotic-like serine/threonine-protein kinase
MAKQLICPVPEETPVDARTSERTLRSLPDDLLREASRRLGIMSLLAAVLWVLAPALDHLAMFLLTQGNPEALKLQATDMMAVASMLISVGVYLYSRSSGREPRFILDLGLVYMVLTALALGLMNHWDAPPANAHVAPMISWIGAVVLMFAAIVPNAPRKMFIAGLIATSMNPAGMLLAQARGTWEFGPSLNVFLMHYPDYLLLGVAVVIAHVVTRLGHHLAKAREMGSYQLVNLLGKGGMGEVWRARHGLLARDAAIKLMQPEMLSGNSGKNAALMRRRFEQEAKTTASLRSPHTVALYDFGVTESGVFYYVMELLDGLDLETLVKRFGPQPAARVACILRQVCRSLEDAHSHGMIHRDIKPTNIFLCRMGNEHDFVKVLDFGLVKVKGGDEAQMTGVGATTGTPAYMAPELALGRADIDGRTDLYGLGCVAYWLLTGKLVFEENGATAMMMAHLNQAPVPPSKRSQLAVPASLDRSIMDCLAKDPAKRPSSADALARALAHNPEIGNWTSEDAKRWWHSNLPDGVVAQVSDGAGKPQPAQSAFTTS